VWSSWICQLYYAEMVGSEEAVGGTASRSGLLLAEAIIPAAAASTISGRGDVLARAIEEKKKTTQQSNW
jgi:hypothetical protein